MFNRCCRQEGESEALTRKAVEMALKGDPTAMRLCMKRVLPRLNLLQILTAPSRDDDNSEDNSNREDYEETGDYEETHDCDS